MQDSKILSKLAETYPEALTNPEKYLGPNYQDVLNFWIYVDSLSGREKKEMEDCYFTLDYNVRWSAKNAAGDAADDVVGWEFKYAAWRTAYDVTHVCIFAMATEELIGDVKNKVSYNLIMSYKKSSWFMSLSKSLKQILSDFVKRLCCVNFNLLNEPQDLPEYVMNLTLNFCIIVCILLIWTTGSLILWPILIYLIN